MMELPLDRAYRWESTHPRDLFLTQPVNGVTRDWNWREALREARSIANHLISQKWPPGSRIVIYSRNCAWWIMADLAIWMAGHVTVPIYPSLSPSGVRQLFEHCSPVASFVGAVDATGDARDPIPTGLHLILFPTAAPRAGAFAWEQIVNRTPPLAANVRRDPDDFATIVYTSGTTGTPKGAMHRFLAFPYFAQAVAQVTGEEPQRALSYLPLAHIAERALAETSAIYFRWHLFFHETTATFLTDLKRAQPSVFFSVPRLYEKFQSRVFEKISRPTVSRLLTVPVAGPLTGKSLLRSMGFGHVRFAASGSAALSPEILRWFRQLGLPLVEGYGTTEIGITHTAPHGECRPGFAGKYAPGVEAKISDEGELLVRSPMNMAGYYDNPAATADVFTRDGFLRTGDRGEISPDGWLKIIGRLKEQFKTAKGKYVSPSKIEGLFLAGNPALEYSLVLGSDLAAPCAVGVLTEAAVREASSTRGRASLEESFAVLLDSVNRQLEPYEQVAFIALVNDRWPIGGEFVTPTLKLRRAPLEERYAASIPHWLGEAKPVVWNF